MRTHPVSNTPKQIENSKKNSTNFVHYRIIKYTMRSRRINQETTRRLAEGPLYALFTLK